MAAAEPSLCLEGIEPWKPHVVADGMLITGQNTQSAGELAQAMLSAMDKTMLEDG